MISRLVNLRKYKSSFASCPLTGSPGSLEVIDRDWFSGFGILRFEDEHLFFTAGKRIANPFTTACNSASIDAVWSWIG